MYRASMMHLAPDFMPLPLPKPDQADILQKKGVLVLKGLARTEQETSRVYHPIKSNGGIKRH